MKRPSKMMISILYFLLFTLGNHVIFSCHPNDKRVLMQIKDHFQNAYPFSEWNPENNECCHWKGLSCQNNTEQAAGRISELIVQKSGATGEFPAIVGELPYLVGIELSDMPNLRGEIPTSLAKLTNLVGITICFTNMSGPIPDFLGHIPSIIMLELYANKFSGSIPSSLSLLNKLYLLDLSANKLSGRIPESFGALKTGLKLWFQGNNELSGEIPKSLGEANITNLDLSFNQFVGDASFLFGKDKPLTDVVLRQNGLKFNLSKVDQLPWRLTLIDIAHNQIYGSIPRQFGQNHQWKHVDMSYNQLCGRVPKGRRLKSFSPLAFAHNKCLCHAPGLPSCK